MKYLKIVFLTMKKFKILTVVCQFTETDEFYNISVKSLDKTDLKAIIRLFKTK